MTTLNVTTLHKELYIVAHMKGVTYVRTMNDCKNLVKRFSAGLKDMIPEVVTLLQLYNVLSCSTASAERSFFYDGVE